MTTYPLSEPATIYGAEDVRNGQAAVVGQGTLADCAEIIEGLAPQERPFARIEMDKLDLSFGAKEIDELLTFLRSESAGLSNQEIAEITETDR